MNQSRTVPVIPNHEKDETVRCLLFAEVWHLYRNTNKKRCSKFIANVSISSPSTNFTNTTKNDPIKKYAKTGDSNSKIYELTVAENRFCVASAGCVVA